jgi:hypothetical protein
MRTSTVLETIPGESAAASGGLLRRAIRSFKTLRLPLREVTHIEQTAARIRAEQLFAVNFRAPWTR